MSEPELTSALKDLPLKIQTASRKQRKETFENVIAVLSNPGINEVIVKKLCKLLPLALFRYEDTTSQSYVKNFLTALLKQHETITVKHLVPVLVEVSTTLGNIVPSKAVSQTALYALSWTVLILRNTEITQGAELTGLLKSQSFLLSAIVGGGNEKAVYRAYHSLSVTWSTLKKNGINLAELCGNELEKLIKGDDSNLYLVLLGAFLIKHLAEKKETSLITKFKGPLLDAFVKNAVSCKQCPRLDVVEACSPLLRQITHDELNTTLLPAIQRALLRNPESVLPSVGCVLAALSLDLSQYLQPENSSNIAGSLSSLLHSKEVTLREAAVASIKALARQCSDSSAVERLLNHIFGILNGSEGKLTTADLKASVLQGIGNLSYCAVTGSSILQLASVAAEKFINVLNNEVHEGTLIKALEMYALWCSKFSNTVPENVIDWFKKGPELKTSTSGVRTAYTECMLSCFNNNTLPQAAELASFLVKRIEKAASQPTQIPVITEALASAVLLLKILTAQPDVESKLNSIWNTLTDMEHPLFVSEKFLTQASTSALAIVPLLCERLILDHEHRLSGPATPLHKSIIFCMTHANYNVRQQTRIVIKKLVGSLGGIKTAQALLQELNKYMDNLEIDNKEKIAIDTGGGVEGKGASEVSAKVYVDCISTLCSTSSLNDNEKQIIGLSSLFCSHQPLVVSIAPNLWINILKHIKLPIYSFLEFNNQVLNKNLIEEFNNKASVFNALKTVSKYGGEFIIPQAVDKVIAELSNSSILTITKDEYLTYLTPEGELYDKSVIVNEGSENGLNAKNMKRESKAYSYKEQVEELQLRKELAEKKRKQGIKVEPELTPKQKEAKKIQLEKESQIRSRLNELNKKIMLTTSLLRSIADGNPKFLSFYFKDIIPILLSCMRSYLAAKPVSELFITCSKCVFDQNDTKDMGIFVGQVTLRLIEPNCSLDSAWQDENLNTAVERAINKILLQITSKSRSFADDDESWRNYFTAPAFCYLFPLIRNALLSGIDGNKNETLINNGLQIISYHAKMRATDDNDLYNPRLLPRKSIFQLLVELITLTHARQQQIAVNTMIDVAYSGSANIGCAKADGDEIVVLLGALENPLSVVRDAALRALIVMEKSLPKAPLPLALELQRRVWVAKFDQHAENRTPADDLWTCAELNLTPYELLPLILNDVIHPYDDIQKAAAEALAEIVRLNPELLDDVLQDLLTIYHRKLEKTAAQLDPFGREIIPAIDHWEPRRGVALALNQIAPLLDPQSVSQLVTFYVSTSLGDINEEVRKNMLASALSAVDLHGKETVNSLLPVFKDFLDVTPDTSNYDAVRQSVVILMGCLARHLEKDDPKVQPIVIKLIEALKTSAQQVQEAVANCLPPLVPAIRDDTEAIISRLLTQLLDDPNYGHRKGAAYGIAGLVKGLGILSLKQLQIMTSLTAAIQDKKNYHHREGALFAFEMLSTMLGRLFEPYIIHVLPHLLLCFGDGNQYVRQATDETARVLMSKLSAHGVKLVLPALLAALEEESWRTKTGSVELLGAMAYCAPKQLSSCLPSIVPKLIEVLSDSHIKVQQSGAQALRQIGSVIRNPEIQAIVPVLLEALQDPARKTAMCLQSLLETQFVHFIDAPSLALIMPVVQRAFQDRSTETRKMAAQIIGNMYSLTGQKDLMPYLPTIIPGLKSSLLDPVPEVRSVSARALGAMVRGMGEASFEDLLPWLMTTLTSESSSVDRSGAAQGLSEVVGGLGVEKLHKLMPEIIATAERTDIAPHVKDGYIMMFIYMPVAFPKEFTPYIGQIINPILKALADENEYVRETALRAGQRIVSLYADTAIALLLPELEKGLFDDNWRIRYSSIQLLGDLLYKISGVSGKMTTETADEDDNFGTEQSHSAIIDALGPERRNKVLAGLYMGRSDVALMVRQAALHVWKVVVTNTPRTLREILPTLFGLLLGCLASTSYDKRQVAARTLGDLVRKLGERVLPEIIPILERGLESDQADQRQGVCIGLSEIMASTSKDMVLTFVNSLVPTVRKALCDPLPEVRQAAAKTFDSLHSTVGVRALDDILPAMLQQLGDPDSELAEYTLDGLRQVMAIKSRVVLPYLVPQLTAPPKANTKALSILASVAGEALTKYLQKILPALLHALSTAENKQAQLQELEYCQTVVLSVTDEAGIRTIMDQLMEASKSEKVEMRRSAATLLCAFCTHTRADYSQYVPQLLRGLIHLFTDSDQEVLQMSWDALSAVIKTLDLNGDNDHVSDIRQAVRFAVSDLKGQDLLPGFCLPKGISPILPIFREAILNGAPETKEQAAQGLGEVIKLTSPEALQPSVVHITGPLIRILGDRFNWNVKASVLETLAVLLNKVGNMLKQFLPQLQTTFLKALNDSNRQVRLKAAVALSELIKIHSRADPLFMELHNGVRSADDSGVRETTLQALRGVITPAGDKMTDPLKKNIYQTLVTMLGHSEDVSRSAAAGCLGALCRWLNKDKLDDLLNEHLLNDDPSLDWTIRHGRSAALFVAIKESPSTIYTETYQDKICKVLLSYLQADRIPIAMNGIRGCGYLFIYLLQAGESLPPTLIQPFLRSMNHTSNEVKQLLARVCISFAKNITPEKMQPEFLRPLLPTLVNGTKEKNTVVKSNSELALVAVLRLRKGDEIQNKYLSLLDVGARESLQDVISKVLRRVANQPEGKDEELDDTLLT